MSKVFSDLGVRLTILTAIPTTPAVLTTTLLNAGKNVSDMAVVGATQFEATDSDSNDEKSYASRGKTEVPTTKNATGKGTYYRDRDGTGLLLATDVVSFHTGRPVLYVVKRKGVPEATAWAAGQDYEYFRFQADAIKTIADADGGYEKVEISYKFNGDWGFGVVAA